MTGAVPSGRRVSWRPPRSVNVYISLVTMSLDWPEVRLNSSVRSNTGVSTYRKPYLLAKAAARSYSARIRSPAGGRRSWVPLGGFSSMGGSGQLAEERIGRPLQPDRGGLTVSWIDVERVGQGQEPFQAGEHVLGRGVRKVVPADGTAEDEVPAEQEFLRLEARTSRGVARRVHDLQREAGHVEQLALHEGSDHRGGVGRNRKGRPPRNRIEDREPILLVDVEGDLVSAELGGRTDMIEVAVGGEHRHGTLSSTPEQGVDTVGRETGVHNHGFILSFKCEKPAVRCEGIVCECLEVHARES